jgi:hypothetical protein
MMMERNRDSTGLEEIFRGANMTAKEANIVTGRHSQVFTPTLFMATC